MQAVLECKQCGASLDIDEGQKIVYCQYCGSANAVSYADRFGLYNRANYLRRQNEFDRAIGVYEDILNGDPHDAEAHYGIALCKYGIEYVDDPKTGRKLPTCHRTRYTLMSQDVDFKKALEDADADTAKIYQKEASQIDAILKRIRELSANQEKYDIFICYKEGDGLGGRTHTSVQAQKIYQKLESSGYKVFFARKTLEKKIGSEYEPIIFSALFSAKVMLVVGMKPEEFQGVWVRNEWIRFRERMEAGEECTLIPLYRDMSPYELPQEFVSLQSLDMGKIGFEQDLLDGLAKLIHATDSGAGHVQNTVDGSGLRKRAYLFLEQGDFQNASAYFERALDIDPEDAQAYLGRLLLELGCRRESDLQNLMVGISGRENYQLAVRFAKGALLEKYQGYAAEIDGRLSEIYKKAEEDRKERQRQMAEQQEKLRQEKEKLRQQQLEKSRRREKMIRRALPFVVIAMVQLFIITNVLYRTIHETFYYPPEKEKYVDSRQKYAKFNHLFLAERNDPFIDDMEFKSLYFRKKDKNARYFGEEEKVLEIRKKIYIYPGGIYTIDDETRLVMETTDDGCFLYEPPATNIREKDRDYKEDDILVRIDWNGDDEKDCLTYFFKMNQSDSGFKILGADSEGYQYLEELRERAIKHYIDYMDSGYEK